MTSLAELAKQAPVRFPTRLTPDQQLAIVTLDAKGYRAADIVAWLYSQGGVTTSPSTVSKVLRLVAKDAERVKKQAPAQPGEVLDLMQALKDSLDPDHRPNVTGTVDEELGI